MLKLFHPQSGPTYGGVVPSRHRELKVRGESIVDTITAYMSRSSYRLPNTHILVQIIRSLEYSIERPFEQVVESVYARAPYVAKHFNLTSQINFGRPHHGALYSSRHNDTVDYLFSNSVVDIDPFDSGDLWTALSPLQVLHHPCTDMRFGFIDGQNPTSWTGYAVTSIDIPLLALQYWKFCKEMVGRFQGDAIYNPNKFIVTRVLPKLYRSHIDYTMFNLFRIKEGLISFVEPKVWFPIALLDMQSLAIRSVAEIHGKLVEKRFPYNQTLESIPMVFAPNAKIGLKLPLVVPTKQLNWLQLMTRMPAIETLISLQGRAGREVNTPYLSSFKRDASGFMAEKAYNMIEPAISRERLVTSIETIMNY